MSPDQRLLAAASSGHLAGVLVALDEGANLEAPQTDVCQSGSCIGASPVTCTASDQCHNAGSCNPATGVCSNPNKANGTACNDGSVCTQTDTCQAGTCAGANPITCSASDICHNVGTCDSGTGVCSNPIKPNGTPCGGGLLCSFGSCETP